MEEITTGKTSAKYTNAMVQSRKLEISFELKARHGIAKGSLIEVLRPAEGRTRIDRDPLPKECESTTTEFMDFKAGDTCLYIGLAFDHWSGKMFMEFIGNGCSMFYDYEQHGAGDSSLGEIFKVALKSVHKQSVI